MQFPVDMLRKIFQKLKPSVIKNDDKSITESSFKAITKKNLDQGEKSKNITREQQSLAQQKLLLEISALEKTLLCSLSRNEIMIMPNRFDLHLAEKTHFSLTKHEEEWASQLNLVKNENHLVFLFSLVEIYTLLNSCYIVSRRLVVKTTVENMAEDIDALIDHYLQNNIDKEAIRYHLRCIYNDIESLRFSANRDNRCSRNLCEKTKMARKLFKKACLHESVAEEFLHELVKPEQAFKARR